ncbi:hypothetical protein [Azospirillum doebereinerae]
MIAWNLETMDGGRAGVVPPDGLWQSQGILRETRFPRIE